MNHLLGGDLIIPAIMEKFKEILPEALDRNLFELIGKSWMLITLPDKNSQSGANAMTASWGCAGILWGKPVCTVFIRPQRYTFGLIEENDRYSLCFPGEKYRSALNYCGSHSGKNEDKLKNAGLTVFQYDNVPCIEQSEIVIVCKKLYADDLKKDAFTDISPLSNYANNDFHRFYVSQIEKVLIKES